MGGGQNSTTVTPVARRFLTGAASRGVTSAGNLSSRPEIGKSDGEDGGEDQGVDIRTNWVDVDDHGKRHKPWRTAVFESTEHRFVDFPESGPQQALFFCKHVEETAGNMRAWLLEITRELRISRKDRIYHELKSLSDAVSYAGEYDRGAVGR